MLTVMPLVTILSLSIVVALLLRAGGVTLVGHWVHIMHGAIYMNALGEALHKWAENISWYLWLWLCCHGNKCHRLYSTLTWLSIAVGVVFRRVHKSTFSTRILITFCSGFHFSTVGGVWLVDNGMRWTRLVFHSMSTLDGSCVWTRWVFGHVLLHCSSCRRLYIRFMGENNEVAAGKNGPI